MDTIAAAGCGVALIIILFIIRWRIRASVKPMPRPEPVDSALLCASGHVVHRLCPHNNVVQGFDVEQKDSLDDHLDILARKLAEKESRLRLSKSKIRETQNEIQNLHAIDNKVRVRYREIMDSLRMDLQNNEKECRKLQEQIEWVSRRRAELKEEASCAAYGLDPNLHRHPGGVIVTSMRNQDRRNLLDIGAPLTYSDMLRDGMVRRGHRLYHEAATELASNLAELQKGRIPDKVIEKSIHNPIPYQRHRKEPHLPDAVPLTPLVIKSSPPPEMERNTSLMMGGYHTPLS